MARAETPGGIVWGMNQGKSTMVRRLIGHEREPAAHLDPQQARVQMGWDIRAAPDYKAMMGPRRTASTTSRGVQTSAASGEPVRVQARHSPASCWGMWTLPAGGRTTFIGEDTFGYHAGFFQGDNLETSSQS